MHILRNGSNITSMNSIATEVYLIENERILSTPSVLAFMLSSELLLFLPRSGKTNRPMSCLWMEVSIESLIKYDNHRDGANARSCHYHLLALGLLHPLLIMICLIQLCIYGSRIVARYSFDMISLQVVQLVQYCSNLRQDIFHLVP